MADSAACPFALQRRLILAITLASTGVTGAGIREEHAVSSLPGTSGAFPAGHFAGYLPVPGDLAIFYYFAQHPDPKKPLIVWMNGGPGSSSVAGLFTELGPFLVNERSMPSQLRQPGWEGDPSEEWRIWSNPEAWSLEASLLAWDQPTGVGFSHCTGPQSCGHVWNDTSSALANYNILYTFFKHFPEERKRNLFIAGESYAGVYVPLLAQLLHNHNAEHSASVFNLKGLLIGNGCVGFGVDGNCGRDSLEVFLTVLERMAIDTDRTLLAEVRTKCHGFLGFAAEHPEELPVACRASLARLMADLGNYNGYSLGNPCGVRGAGNWGDGSSYTCGSDHAISTYFARLDVQEALHAISIGEQPRPWLSFDGNSDFYNITAANVVPVYRELLSAGYPITVYNGQLDTVVPAVGAQGWIPRVTSPDLLEPRRKWAWPADEVAGHVVAYASGLTFVTVQGAGHMVPAERPRQARALMRAVINNSPMPAYEGPRCKPLWLGRGYYDFCADEKPSGAELVI